MKAEIRHAIGVLLAGALLIAGRPLHAQEAPVDTTGLADGPYATMAMLYERTFLRVDVMRLWVRFGEASAARLEALVLADAPADSVASAAIHGRDALVRSRFLRDVSIDQFLEGVRDNLALVVRAGLIDEAQRATIEGDVVTQYGALVERGILEGDSQWYRILGDTVDVVLQARTGEVILRERVVGPERRFAVLGGYLVKGSDFRDKLVQSLGRATM